MTIAEEDEELGINCVGANNDYVDMSKSNIITSMHPLQRANMEILMKYNPKLSNEYELSRITGKYVKSDLGKPIKKIEEE